MSKVVVLSETNCIHYLRMHGFKPSEFYTDLDIFRQRSMFFNDVIVVILYSATCLFPRKQMDELTKMLHNRAMSEDSAIADLVIVSDSILPNCEDYFLYRHNPLHCVRYNGWKKVSTHFSLKDLQYEESDKTITYLTDRDYGFAPDALEKVRAIDKHEKSLIALIQKPVFE